MTDKPDHWGMSVAERLDVLERHLIIVSELLSVVTSRCGVLEDRLAIVETGARR